MQEIGLDQRQTGLQEIGLDESQTQHIKQVLRSLIKLDESCGPPQSFSVLVVDLVTKAVQFLYQGPFMSSQAMNDPLARHYACEIAQSVKYRQRLDVLLIHNAKSLVGAGVEKNRVDRLVFDQLAKI
ncbi:hypothetical protein GALL_547980 [mine drainage metagenome]|uniref:Uncharacterized protein n=1 Tax=mine drainage metagenome TaxID=410659 RepID=A0A1J5PJD1_9ZZZZ